MSSCPNPAEPETAAETRARRTAKHLQLLDQLLDITMDLTRLVQTQAHAAAATAEALHEAAPDFTGAFDRMSRSVRRAIMLAHKIGQAEKAPAAANRIAARKQIIRTVEDTIERDAPKEAVERLHGEFLERLDSPDLEDDLDQRPIDDIIAEICHDLGIAALPGTHPWKRRTPQDVAVLCARAAARPAPAPQPGAWRAGDWQAKPRETGTGCCPGEARIRGP